MDSKIALKTVNELLNENFFIPSFQRGYRWTSEEVKDLLDDLLEFHGKEKSKEEFYCLQPIVVTPTDSKFSVIDGQQRLTTIYIILSHLEYLMTVLGKKKFTLEFETRKDSGIFLEKIDKKKRDENIDYFHICQALETVENWFASKDGSTQINILHTLTNETGNNVQVIWYEVPNTTENDAIEIFTRINMGKIPLTNAELIKALFLRRANFEGEDETKRLRQLEIAGEWDRMEYFLRNDEFWEFLQDGKIKYDNRIEFIFDLMSDNVSMQGEIKNMDKNYTFRYFNELFNQNSDIESIWKEIKQYFQTFKQWFDNHEYYHLVGYLVTVGISIKEIKDVTGSLNKDEFTEYLIERITKQIDRKIEDLTYSENKPLLRRVLLLFNIVTILNNLKTNTRFQFGRYKTDNWDIEHIHSAQSEMPEAANHQAEWLEEFIKFSPDKDLAEKAQKYLDNSSKSKGGKFDELYKEIVSKYSESQAPEDVNDLSNLTLLDASTNRGYKNAIFPLKRKSIIEKDTNGTFIPICTKNVFLKYYSGDIAQMSFWGKEDRASYKKNLVDTLTRFLKINKVPTDE